MNMIGVVAISVLAAIFLCALFVGVGTLIWMAYTLKRQLQDSKKENGLVHAETTKILVAYQAESKAQIDSAKASFAAVRNAIQAQLEAQQKELHATLDEHRRQMGVSIEKINADALVTVATRLTQVCIRTEKAISVLQQLILATEQTPATDYPAEAFAPEESQFGAPPSGFSLSQTARFDQEADAASNRESFTEFQVEA